MAMPSPSPARMSIGPNAPGRSTIAAAAEVAALATAYAAAAQEPMIAAAAAARLTPLSELTAVVVWACAETGCAANDMLNIIAIAAMATIANSLRK